MHNWPRYISKAATRTWMRRRLRPLVRWEPMSAPVPGYTVLIGGATRLLPVARANLTLLARQNATNCAEVILILDGRRDDLPADFERSCHDIMQTAGHAPGSRPIPVKIVCYNDVQVRTSRQIDWGWAYAWMSWSLGIAHCTTRYAILHDLDALLLGPNVLEERFEAIQREQVEWLGIDPYPDLGLDGHDAPVRTFEMIFDAAFVREHFNPIDLFNKMGTIAGRRLEFDTTIHAQIRAGRRRVVPVDETLLVHPSQMICQYVDHSAGRERLPEANNLLMLPYFLLLGGDGRAFSDVAAQLRNRPDGPIRLWGGDVHPSALPLPRADWLLKQAIRVEEAVFGAPRPEVADYFESIRRAAASAQLAVKS